jgi:hypothetical protein
MATLLNDMPLEWADQVFLHPMRKEGFRGSDTLPVGTSW